MATSVLWILLTVSLISGTGCQSSKVVAQLLKDIFHGYNKAIRPVKNMSTPTLVEIRMTLYQIRELAVKFQYLQTNVWLTFDERNQFLQANVWLNLIWKDEYLAWNPSKYGGLKSLKVPSENVWRPDVVLYNSVDDERLVTEILANTEVNLTAHGDMWWSMPAMLKTSCKINMADYPFDIQKCPMQFGSWTHHGFQINVTNYHDSAILENFITNGEFEVLGVPSVRNEVIYTCCKEPYPDVTFTIILKRRPLFVLINLILPCLFLIAIGVLVFYLPPVSGEKVGLAVTVLLSMTVFLLLVIENIPPTSEVIPLIEQFFIASISLLGVATMVTVIIMNFHFNGDHSTSPPQWTRMLAYDVLARITCMRPVVNQQLESFKNRRISKGLKKTKSKAEGNGTGVTLLNFNSGGLENGFVCNTNNPVPPTRETAESILLLKAILEELKEQRASRKEVTERKEEFREIKCEWQLIALILDRSFLLCFAVLSLIAIVAVFARIPNEYFQSHGR